MPAPKLREIEDRYGMRVHSLVPLMGSDRAWRLGSDSGDLVLRLHGPERRAAHAGEIAVLSLLERAGYPAPRLVTTREGSALTQWDDREGYITTWVAGNVPDPDTNSARRLGSAVGQLHSLDIRGMGIPETGFTVATERESFWRLDSDPSVRAWKGYTGIRDELVSAWSHLPDLDDLPRSIVHTDVLFDNSVRTPAGEIVLIDWDDTGIGPAIQDVGYFLVHSVMHANGGVNTDLEIGQAFLEGYEAVRPIGVAEWERFPDALLFGALAYVLAPWESRVQEQNWLRTRYVLDHQEFLVKALRS